MRFFVTSLLVLAACMADDSAVTGALYGECENDMDCEGEQTCHRIEGQWTRDGLMARICSIECSSSLDCPASAQGPMGVCHDLNGLFNRCYPSCDSDDECASGYVCTSVSGLGQRICIP